MGVHQNIDFDKFPEQYTSLNKEVDVTFNYSSRTVKGRIVRDDNEPPGKTIILLNDGRYILSTECQYSFSVP